MEIQYWNMAQCLDFLPSLQLDGHNGLILCFNAINLSMRFNEQECIHIRVFWLDTN